MQSYYEKLATLQKFLRSHDIQPVVYGSIAVSFWLGEYKDQFTDYDVLIEDHWLEENWHKFIKLLETQGFTLKDEHEHSFTNGQYEVNFAKLSILERDAICSSDETIDIRRASYDFRTLSVPNLLRAYEFSVKDGYRRDIRSKNDTMVIMRLKTYLAK